MVRVMVSTEDAVGQIRREALNAGASSITLSSQAIGVLNSELKAANKVGGLCRSMAIRWLAGRKSGKNFLAELLKPGGAVDTALVKAMADEYDAAGTNMDLHEQAAHVVAQLTARNLQSTGIDDQYGIGAGGMIGVGAWFTQNSEHSGTGRLRFIETYGEYSHAMAIDLREQYAIFFDPNFGAFTFPTHLKMVEFLSRSMFTREGERHLYAAAKPFSSVVKIGFQ